VTNRADWLGRSVSATIQAVLILLRRAYVEPREWVRPRAAAALLLRIWGVPGQPFVVAVVAVVLGAVAVANHNATWGRMGLALGA
jgi:hypothetical protein